MSALATAITSEEVGGAKNVYVKGTPTKPFYGTINRNWNNTFKSETTSGVSAGLNTDFISTLNNADVKTVYFTNNTDTTASSEGNWDNHGQTTDHPTLNGVPYYDYEGGEFTGFFGAYSFNNQSSKTLLSSNAFRAWSSRVENANNAYNWCIIDAMSQWSSSERDSNLNTVVLSLPFTPTTQTIKITTNPATDLTYDGSLQTLGSITTDPSDCTVEYKVNDGTYSTSAPQATNAGTYTVGYRASKSGYATVEGTFSVTISPVKVSIPSAVENLAYNGDEQTGVVLPEGETKYTLSKNTGTDASSNYEAEAELQDKTNYTWQKEDGTTTTEIQKIKWSIAKATPADTDFVFTAPTAPEGKTNPVYTGSEQKAKVELGKSQKGNQKTGAGTLTILYSSDGGSTWNATPTNAGDYKIKINVAGGDNYTAATDITNENWKFTIDKAQNTMTFSLSQNNATSVFDKNNASSLPIDKANNVPEGNVTYTAYIQGTTSASDNFTITEDATTKDATLVCNANTPEGTYNLVITATSGGTNYEEKTLPETPTTTTSSNFTWSVVNKAPQCLQQGTTSTKVNFLPAFDNTTANTLASVLGEARFLKAEPSGTNVYTQLVSNEETSSNEFTMSSLKDKITGTAAGQAGGITNTFVTGTPAKPFYGTYNAAWSEAFGTSAVTVYDFTSTFKNKLESLGLPSTSVYTDRSLYYNGSWVNKGNWDGHDVSPDTGHAQPANTPPSMNGILYSSFRNGYGVSLLGSQYTYDVWSSRGNSSDNNPYYYYAENTLCWLHNYQSSSLYPVILTSDFVKRTPLQSTFNDGTSNRTVNFLPAFGETITSQGSVTGNISLKQVLGDAKLAYKDSNGSYHELVSDSEAQSITMAGLKSKITDKGITNVYLEGTPAKPFYGTVDASWNSVFVLNSEPTTYPKEADGINQTIAQGLSTKGIKTAYPCAKYGEASLWEQNCQGFSESPYNASPTPAPKLNEVSYASFYESYGTGVLSTACGGIWSSTASKLNESTLSAFNFNATSDHKKWYNYFARSEGNYCSVLLSNSFGADSLQSKVTLTYNANNASSGDVPAPAQEYSSGSSVSILGNTSSLTPPNVIKNVDGVEYSHLSNYYGDFVCWNTEPDGSGKNYYANDTINISKDTILYAKWNKANFFPAFNNESGKTLSDVLGANAALYYEDNTGTMQQFNISGITSMSGFQTEVDNKGGVEKFYIKGTPAKPFYGTYNTTWNTAFGSSSTTTQYDFDGSFKATLASLGLPTTSVYTDTSGSGNWDAHDVSKPPTLNNIDYKTFMLAYKIFLSSGQWCAWSTNPNVPDNPGKAYHYDGNNGYWYYWSRDTFVGSVVLTKDFAPKKLQYKFNLDGQEKTVNFLPSFGNAAEGGQSTTLKEVLGDAKLIYKENNTFKDLNINTVKSMGDLKNTIDAAGGIGNIYIEGTPAKPFYGTYDIAWNNVFQDTVNYALLPAPSTGLKDTFKSILDISGVETVYYDKNGITRRTADNWDSNDQSKPATLDGVNYSDYYSAYSSFLSTNSNRVFTSRAWDQTLAASYSGDGNWSTNAYTDQVSIILSNPFGASTSYPTLSYDTNGATTGDVPVEPKNYNFGESVTISGNLGYLAKPNNNKTIGDNLYQSLTNYYFAGWNTQPDGSGKTYSTNDTFNITGDTTLYAKWNKVNFLPAFNNESGKTLSDVLGANASLYYEDDSGNMQQLNIEGINSMSDLKSAINNNGGIEKFYLKGTPAKPFFGSSDTTHNNVFQASGTASTKPSGLKAEFKTSLDIAEIQTVYYEKDGTTQKNTENWDAHDTTAIEGGKASNPPTLNNVKYTDFYNAYLELQSGCCIWAMTSSVVDANGKSWYFDAKQPWWFQENNRPLSSCVLSKDFAPKEWKSLTLTVGSETVSYYPVFADNNPPSGVSFATKHNEVFVPIDNPTMAKLANSAKEGTLYYAGGPVKAVRSVNGIPWNNSFKIPETPTYPYYASTTDLKDDLKSKVADGDTVEKLVVETSGTPTTVPPTINGVSVSVIQNAYNPFGSSFFTVDPNGFGGKHGNFWTCVAKDDTYAYYWNSYYSPGTSSFHFEKRTITNNQSILLSREFN